MDGALPFSGVGIYISGDSRACRNQPNLTPTWVKKQLANGWRLLPITLGPQANCLDRFPRYKDDKVIKKAAKNNYAKARKQARKEATKTVAAAKALGISPGSTLWYDLEGFDLTNTQCRQSAMWFLSAYSKRIKNLNYVSGVYSSAGSGIKMLDDARVNEPGKYVLPDRLWVARWDGIANLEAPGYLRADGWMPHSRVKQYKGGHNETWGGVTINIDSNFLSLGKGTVAAAEKARCKEKVAVSLPKYAKLTAAKKKVKAVKAAQCLLRKQKLYKGELTGTFDARTLAAANTFQSSNRLASKPVFNRKSWVSLLSQGKIKVVKRGSKGAPVRRLQRALTAATKQTVPVTGVFDAATEAAAKQWQRNIGVTASGVINTSMWQKLQAGKFK
ncbi:glycoside hydrolase domain-containing protein [Nocardioides alcanivorans]|uniref:glycoside hydrolase domain-containing protein n=1 Tax=Nocardioides alcanivorans TaxID=2897352 RepID=UPI001F1A3C34|nr:glycoside hydrolase domain-containing protein [Nocardioides alcanivorans]